MKNVKSLKVSIPVKFRENLIKRFTYENGIPDPDFECQGIKKIPIECPLCKEFKNPLCAKCPFKKFETRSEKGCLRWIREVLNLKSIYELPFDLTVSDMIYWYVENDEKVKETLNMLKEKAKELIVWKYPRVKK